MIRVCHPAALPRSQLRGAWQQGLAARAKVLAGEPVWPFVKGPFAVEAIDGYLHALHKEGARRGMRLDARRLGPPGPWQCAEVSRADLQAELAELGLPRDTSAHPSFVVV